MSSTGPDTERRILTTVHLGMVAAVFLFGALLAIWRTGSRPVAASPRLPEWTLLAYGVVQYAIVTRLARRMVAGGRRDPRDRVRTSFLLRFAAAEAIGVFGLVLGLTGARLTWAIALLAASLVALASAAPTREAYGEALRAASPPAV